MNWSVILMIPLLFWRRWQPQSPANKKTATTYVYQFEFTTVQTLLSKLQWLLCGSALGKKVDRQRALSSNNAEKLHLTTDFQVPRLELLKHSSHLNNPSTNMISIIVTLNGVTYLRFPSWYCTLFPGERTSRLELLTWNRNAKPGRKFVRYHNELRFLTDGMCRRWSMSKPLNFTGCHCFWMVKIS